MSKLTDDLRVAHNQGTKVMMIQNRLDKLFYEDRDGHDRYGLHASAVIAPEGEFCLRAMVLSLFFRQDQGKQLPVKTLRIFAQGNATHEKWYSLFRKAGIDIAIERTLWLEQYDLSFTIDAIIDVFGELIVDVKTMNSFLYKKSTGHPKGEKQVNFYLWALSKYTGKPHRRGAVLCEDKNTQEFRIVPVEYDKEKVRPYVERLKEIQKYKHRFEEEGKLPKRKCDDPNSKLCQKCVMHSACWNTGIGRRPLSEEEKRGPGQS